VDALLLVSLSRMKPLDERFIPWIATLATPNLSQTRSNGLKVKTSINYCLSVPCQVLILRIILY